MHKLKEAWIEAFTFIRTPHEPSLAEIEESGITRRFSRLFQILLLDLICMLPLMGVLGLIEHFGILNLDDHALKEMLEQFDIWWIVVFVVLVGPIAEELIFRLHLSRRWNLVAGVMEIFGAISNRTSRQEAAQRVKVQWDHYYSWFFLLNSAAFAFIHILNFDSDAVPIWLVPLIVLPQFVAGLFFGYIRVKNGGLLWSFALHALHNAVLITPVLLFELPPN